MDLLVKLLHHVHSELSKAEIICLGLMEKHLGENRKGKTQQKNKKKKKLSSKQSALVVVVEQTCKRTTKRRRRTRTNMTIKRQMMQACRHTVFPVSTKDLKEVLKKSDT